MTEQQNRIVADCEIIENYEVAPHFYRCVLNEPTIAKNSRPGQFVNVRVSESYDPLLRRPFSIHAVDAEVGTLSLLYDVKGHGTIILSEMNKGETISVLGPLGKPFDIGENKEAHHILVAGGCGAAPMHFLSDWTCKKFGCDKVTVLVGARSDDAVLCYSEFVSHGVDIKVATEDGSSGFKGFVTQLLDEQLSARDQATEVRVYACGPMPMLREVARVCQKQNVDTCQVSLESNMACGLGVCMGCIVKGCDSHDESCEDWKYNRICTDGPVFDARELVWE